MALTELKIAHFRNLVSAELEPIPQGMNLIYGQNGSGKTSLLEAVYYLSVGRSFRSSNINRVVCDLSDRFQIFGQLVSENDQYIPVGIERGRNGENKMRISGKDVDSISELASLTPVQLITAHCHNLLDAPDFRRKYLDWGVFYQSADFLRVWKVYNRALKQRNAILRATFANNELESWTQELIKHALQLNTKRQEYIHQLIPLLSETLEDLLPIQNLEIHYDPGWNQEISYEMTLNQSLQKDQQLGYTSQGPHRADLKILVNRMPAKDILSRGQQKLLVCGMLLSQGILLKKLINKKPTYLVDDLPSELDTTSRSNLMRMLSEQNTQVFITAVEREALDGFLTHSPMKMFHVEHGNVGSGK